MGDAGTHGTPSCSHRCGRQSHPVSLFIQRSTQCAILFSEVLHVTIQSKTDLLIKEKLGSNGGMGIGTAIDTSQEMLDEDIARVLVERESTPSSLEVDAKVFCRTFNGVGRIEGISF